MQFVSRGLPPVHEIFKHTKRFWLFECYRAGPVQFEQGQEAPTISIGIVHSATSSENEAQCPIPRLSSRASTRRACSGTTPSGGAGVRCRPPSGPAAASRGGGGDLRERLRVHPPIITSGQQLAEPVLQRHRRG